jgi:hypothetical protein
LLCQWSFWLDGLEGWLGAQKKLWLIVLCDEQPVQHKKKVDLNVNLPVGTCSRWYYADRERAMTTFYVSNKI